METLSPTREALISKISPKKKLVRQVATLLAQGRKLGSSELGDELDCSRYSINKAIRELRELGWVYTHSWSHAGGSNCLAPVYGWKGERFRKDTPKPEPKTRSEINRDWNARNRVYRAAVQRVKRGVKPSIWQGLIG